MPRLGVLLAVALSGVITVAEADTLLHDSGIPGGICVVIGSNDAALPLAVAEHDRFVVHALFDDEARLDAAREAIRRRGLYGRVSADRCDPGRLPYVDNLINVVVVADAEQLGSGRLSLDEVARVLAPLGAAYIGSPPAAGLDKSLRSAGLERIGMVEAAGVWLKAAKPWPEEIDPWSHHLHGPDGNPVANDRVVGPPEHYQWIAGPTWAQSHESDSNLRGLVTAAGRIYYIVNEAPTSLAGPDSPPDQWFLTACDAFNGLPLWKLPIQEWGWREWKPSWFTPRPGVIPINLDKRVVAAGDDLFVTLGYRAPVSRIDGRTGEVLAICAGTEGASEILHRDGRLVVSVLEGDRARVKCVDGESGRLLWVSEKDYGGTTTDYYRFTAAGGAVPAAKVDPTLDIATDGRVVGLLDGRSVVCLDYETGAERWRTEFPLVKEDYSAGRIDAVEKVWTGTMIVSDGVIVHASPNQLAAFSAASGELLWKQPKKFLQHLWYEWKDVFVIDGRVWTWSSELGQGRLEGGGASTWPMSANGYNLHTGALEREVPLGNTFKTHHHHRCYRNKATVRYILASRRGTEFVDLEGGAHSVNNWVRGTCHMGMMPANGLQYAPPHPCQCYSDEKLNAFNALAAARVKTSLDRVNPTKRLEHGPAFDLPSPAGGRGAGGEGGRSLRPLSASNTPHPATSSPPSPTRRRGKEGRLKPHPDWPTFRGDAARSGSSTTRLPDEAELLWRVELGTEVAPAIGVGRQVFVPLVDEHQVVALDATDGAELWRFTAGARIDSPPTFDRGALLFGSADGCVYRVRAADGGLIWRHRAVAEDRRMAAFGQLESVWPVHGSVLVDDGSETPTAYFAAGRSSHLDGGLRLVALDAASGEVVREETLAGPDYIGQEIEQNYRLPMGVLPDVLRLEGESLFMRSVKFDTQLKQQPGVPVMKLVGGFLDNAYFKRMHWAMGTSGHARLLVHDGSHAYCLRMFNSLKGLDPKVYFTPGKEGYLLFAHDLKSGKNAWSYRVPIRGRAMAVTANQLCLAGPPDVVEPGDPLAAFEGRRGGVLRFVDKADGQTVSEHELPAPPVFNGAAAAHGRLILSLEDGSIACFGQTPPK